MRDASSETPVRDSSSPRKFKTLAALIAPDVTIIESWQWSDGKRCKQVSLLLYSGKVNVRVDYLAGDVHMHITCSGHHLEQNFKKWYREDTEALVQAIALAQKILEAYYE